MKPAMLTAIAVLFVGIQAGQAEKIRVIAPAADSPVDAFVIKLLRRPVAVPHNHTHPHGMSAPVKIVKPSFPIPKGKFGISLKDGTKMIGVPKAKTVTLKTSFGIATIPRTQISKIQTVKGETRVYLLNGDRVSGKWVTTVMQFETRFGMLAVPVRSLVWLHSPHASLGENTPVSSKGNRRGVPRPSIGITKPSGNDFSDKPIPPGFF